MPFLLEPEHPEYETYQDWVAQNFDPDVFNLNEINQKLESFK